MIRVVEGAIVKTGAGVEIVMGVLAGGSIISPVVFPVRIFSN
jgi:hypothetical protein